MTTVAFYILVIIIAALLWFLLSFLFRPIGKLGHRLWKDAKDAMNDDKNNNVKEQEE